MTEERKQIQELRIRNYFVQSAKDILRSEGLKGISVRNVAQNAGYSYATLYNYFKDIRFLVFECVKDFQEECIEFIEERIVNTTPGIEKLRTISKAYIEYFVEYPGIFELFYIEKMSDYGNSAETAEIIYTFLDRLCENDWKIYAQTMDLSDSFINKLKDQLRFTLIGLLLFYLNRNYPANYKEFISRMENQLDYIWE
jgi:AcrR family transcriptional regulator